MKGCIPAVGSFTWNNVVWHQSVRSIAAGCRSPNIAVIDFFGCSAPQHLTPIDFQYNPIIGFCRGEILGCVFTYLFIYLFIYFLDPFTMK